MKRGGITLGVEMPEKRMKCDREFRDGAVPTVEETGKPIVEFARDLGVNEGTLVNQARSARDGSDGLSNDDVEELRRFGVGEGFVALTFSSADLGYGPSPPLLPPPRGHIVTFPVRGPGRDNAVATRPDGLVIGRAIGRMPIRPDKIKIPRSSVEPWDASAALSRSQRLE